MDGLIQEKVSQKANELTATYDEKIMNYEDRYRITVILLCLNMNLTVCCVGNKIYNASYLSRRINFEIYAFQMKTTKQNSSTIVKGKVCNLSCTTVYPTIIPCTRPGGCFKTCGSGHDYCRLGSRQWSHSRVGTSKCTLFSSSPSALFH